MQRALILLNTYGREAGQRNLKNRQKMYFLCFQAIFELMSASLTTTWVEQNQCPLHQSILLTQGPIHEIFTKKFWELAILKNALFLSQPFWNLFSKKKKKKKILLNFRKNTSKFTGYQGIFEILMIILVSSQKSPTPNISVPSVPSIRGLELRTEVAKAVIAMKVITDI